jgi:carbon-monoxide dehydrogenase large subunit
VLKYVAVDDCGKLVNPALVEGQIAGGVAQGIGGALWEHCVYDEDGQLLTTTLMDYALPRADTMPPIETHHLETAAPSIAGGFKGSGEAGTTGAPAAILNAVNDALSPFGVFLTEQPVTPERIVRALASARR